MTTYLITGATSGLGRQVAQQLAKTADRLVLPVRDAGRGEALKQALRRWGAAQVTTPELDLASLASVERFLAAWQQQPLPLDGLLFNAGGQASGQLERTQDGLETTFAVNHLAHHRLYLGLRQALADGARVGWVSSGTHTPENRAARLTGFRGASGAPVAELAAGRYPQTDPADQCRSAYATSKLYNLMSARHFAAIDPDHQYFSFDPGLMPGTGLARQHGSLARGVWHGIMPVMARLGVIPDGSTPKRSGAQLAAYLDGRKPIPSPGAHLHCSGKLLEPYFPRAEQELSAELFDTSDALLAKAGKAS